MRTVAGVELHHHDFHFGCPCSRVSLRMAIACAWVAMAQNLDGNGGGIRHLGCNPAVGFLQSLPQWPRRRPAEPRSDHAVIRVAPTDTPTPPDMPDGELLACDLHGS